MFWPLSSSCDRIVLSVSHSRMLKASSSILHFPYHLPHKENSEPSGMLPALDFWGLVFQIDSCLNCLLCAEHQFGCFTSVV